MAAAGFLAVWPSLGTRSAMALPLFVMVNRLPAWTWRIKRRELSIRASVRIRKSSSQYQQILLRRFPGRCERNASIKSDEPSFMPCRKGKQIYVGQLPRSMNPGRVHDICIQHADFIRPEFMDVLLAGLG